MSPGGSLLKPNIWPGPSFAGKITIDPGDNHVIRSRAVLVWLDRVRSGRQELRLGALHRDAHRRLHQRARSTPHRHLARRRAFLRRKSGNVEDHSGGHVGVKGGRAHPRLYLNSPAALVWQSPVRFVTSGRCWRKLPATNWFLPDTLDQESYRARRADARLWLFLSRHPGDRASWRQRAFGPPITAGQPWPNRTS